MKFNEEFYKKDKNGKLEYTTLFDIEDTKEINIPDDENLNKQSLLKSIDDKSFEYKYIKQGSILVKICRNQFGMNCRYFYIDKINYALRWFSPNKKYESSCIKLSNIVRVKKATKKMMTEFSGGVYINGNIYKLSIKISYYNDQRKEFLYVVCKNKLEQEIWLSGLGKLINNEYDNKFNFERYREYLDDDIYQYSDLCTLFYYNDNLEGISNLKAYITSHSNKNLKLKKKIKNIENIKDMNDEIKCYITPQINQIEKLIDDISCLLNQSIGRNISKKKKTNTSILLAQLQIVSQINNDIFKVLSKKYKKQIKQKNKKILFKN